MGMHFVCLGPENLEIDPEVLAYCQSEAEKSGGKLEVLDDVDVAVKDADVIYTDIWVSMGEDESLYKPRVEMLSPYKVTAEMIKKACGIKKAASDAKQTVATLSADKLKEIAEYKMPDLNANDVEAAMRIIAGTARNMGVAVEGME